MLVPSDVAPDTFEMPTCRPFGYVVPLPVIWATSWSIVGSWVELVPTWAPDSAAAGMLVWGALFGTMMLKPVSTDSQGLTACRGASCSLSVQALPPPAADGTQRFGMMPLPKNQVPNRIGSAPPAA